MERRLLSTIGLVAAVLAVSGIAASQERIDFESRIAIQETILYAYAYAYDSKDCSRWSNLFTASGTFETPDEGVKGREAILEWCSTRQKGPLANVRSRHNVTNVVFDELSPTFARVRAYVLITWQRTGESTPGARSMWTYHYEISKQDGQWALRSVVLRPEP